jgi:hypothetical protein
VSALKEQLATANQSLQLVEGKGGGGNKPSGGGGGDMEHNAMDIISRSGLEVELAAKEKEVSRNILVKFLEYTVMAYRSRLNVPLILLLARIYLYSYIHIFLFIRSQIRILLGYRRL